MGTVPWHVLPVGNPSPHTFLELKAEIEKLKAAQRSRQNVDPERYRLCQQEIAALRMKLHQQERDMAEMQRWGVRGLGECGLAPPGWRAGGLAGAPPLPSRPPREWRGPRGLSHAVLSGLLIRRPPCESRSSASRCL